MCSGSQAESLASGARHSQQRAEARLSHRLSQLERLKASRQSAQATRAAGQRLSGKVAPEAQQPAQPRLSGARATPPAAQAGGFEQRAPAQAATKSGVQRGSAAGRQKCASGGYLDRYTAACLASGKSFTSLPEPRDEVEAPLSEPEGQLAASQYQADVRERETEIVSLAARHSDAGSPQATLAPGGAPEEATAALPSRVDESGQEDGAAHALQCSPEAALPHSLMPPAEAAEACGETEDAVQHPGPIVHAQPAPGNHSEGLPETEAAKAVIMLEPARSMEKGLSPAEADETHAPAAAKAQQ